MLLLAALLTNPANPSTSLMVIPRARYVVSYPDRCEKSRRPGALPVSVTSIDIPSLAVTAGRTSTSCSRLQLYPTRRRQDLQRDAVRVATPWRGLPDGARARPDNGHIHGMQANIES